jgi:outer membrane lipoprotein-sorting protein
MLLSNCRHIGKLPLVQECRRRESALRARCRMISKTILGLVLALPFGLAMGLAQSARGDTTPPLPPERPAAPAPANPAPAKPAPSPSAATPAPFVPMDPAVAIQKANAYFNQATTMVGDFVQISGDRRSEGKMYVQKPGRLRFEYADPATLDIIADGSTVAVIDRKLATTDFYFIWQTPLKFLLKDQIDLNKDVNVIDVTSDPDTVAITVEDKFTLGGTSRIKLMFDPTQFQLKQWEVTDPQGNDTLVSLFNVDFTAAPDPSLFKITQEPLDNTDSRTLNQSN